MTPIQEEEVTTMKIITILRKNGVYIALIISSIAFLTHQNIEEFSKEFIESKKAHKEAKNKRRKVVLAIIEASKGTELYNEFEKQDKITNDLWDKYKEVKKDEEVFVFISLRYFIERFGLMVAFSIYALYNLIKSHFRERKNIGSKVYHTYMLSIPFFYFFWMFQKFQDLSVAAYNLMTFISAILVTAAIWLITRYKKDSIQKLREQNFTISKLALRNAKPEKQEETFEVLKKIANDK